MSDDGKGRKFDAGKPRMSLLSSQFLLGMGQVMQFGEKKYDKHNWRNGIEVGRLLDAALRHILKWAEGNSLDDESGQDHLFHAAVDLMMAWETAYQRSQFDDRFTELPVASSVQQPPQPQQSKQPLQLDLFPSKEQDSRTRAAVALVRLQELEKQLSLKLGSESSESVTAPPRV